MLTSYQSLPMEQRPGIDALLAQWWMQLIESDELEKTFGKSCHALSQFFYVLTTKESLFLFDKDAKGISIAFPVAPVMNAAFLTLWVAPRLRAKGDRQGLQTIEEGYEAIFTQYPVILGVTKQERLLPIHERWGYTVYGKLPAIFDGEVGWLVVLTKEQYEATKARRHIRAVGGRAG